MFVGSEDLKDKRRGFKVEGAGSRIASYFNEATLLFVSAACRCTRGAPSLATTANLSYISLRFIESFAAMTMCGETRVMSCERV
jgi:hypothetical protein